MAAIIFDMDGTISDSFDFVADFMAGQAGKAPLSLAERKKLRGLSMVAMARQLGFKWWHSPMLLYRGRRHMRKVIGELHYFEGIPEVIQKLHAEGHELFILSTNSLDNVRSFLHKHELHTYFLEIYGGVGVFSKAPALRDLLREQNLEADQAVYVGDELRDMQAAQAAGLRSIAVSWGFSSRSNLKAQKPTAIADNPHELLRILEDI